MAEVKIRKSRVKYLLLILLFVGLIAGCYYVYYDMYRKWDDQSTWQINEVVKLPQYDEKIKIYKKEIEPNKFIVNVDYCLMLPTEYNGDSAKVHCSLVPYVYLKSNMFRPYEFHLENGIEIMISRNSKLPNKLFGIEGKNVTFEKINGNRIPVKLQLIYINEYPDKSFVNVLSHWVNSILGEREIVTQYLDSWEVSSIPKFSDLTPEQIENFKNIWVKKAIIDISNIYGLSEIYKLSGQELVDSLVKNISFEGFLCKRGTGIGCELNITNNPAETIGYAMYAWKTKEFDKIKNEVTKRVYPFADKGSVDVYTCDEGGKKDDCSHYANFTAYQVPFCPILSIVTKNKDEDYQLFLAYSKKFTNQERSNALSFYNTAKKSIGDNKLQMTKVIRPFDVLCSMSFENPRLRSVVVADYYKYAFRGNSFFLSDQQAPTLINEKNILQVLYESEYYSPYKYSLVIDYDNAKELVKSGYNQQQSELDLIVPYNILLSIVSTYLIGSAK